MAFKNDFRPDVIAGNPPYNNGMDIDFVFSAFDIAKVAVSMITPAKWQTAEADQRIDSTHSYGDFREKIVPYIDKVVFYPDAAEIFEIRNVDGISIYTLTHELVDKCHIINRCLHQKHFNSEAYRDIKQRQSLHNIGEEIVKSLGSIESFKFKNITHNKKYEVWTGNQVNGGCGWGYADRQNPCSLVNLDGAFKCIGSSVIVDTEIGEADSRGASTCVFESDNKEECQSFVSWLDTKLVRFLVASNIGKLTGILTDDYFRFVPIPFKGFNEIYTDKEMYKHYNISEKHIEIIESIILPR